MERIFIEYYQLVTKMNGGHPWPPSFLRILAGFSNLNQKSPARRLVFRSENLQVVDQTTIPLNGRVAG